MPSVAAPSARLHRHRLGHTGTLGGSQNSCSEAQGMINSPASRAAGLPCVL